MSGSNKSSATDEYLNVLLFPLAYSGSASASWKEKFVNASGRPEGRGLGRNRCNWKIKTISQHFLGSGVVCQRISESSCFSHLLLTAFRDTDFAFIWPESRYLPTCLGKNRSRLYRLKAERDPFQLSAATRSKWWLIFFRLSSYFEALPMKMILLFWPKGETPFRSTTGLDAFASPAACHWRRGGQSY